MKPLRSSILVLAYLCSHFSDVEAQWLQTGKFEPTQCFASSGTNLFAGTKYTGGIYLTTDNGTNWTAVNNGLTNRSVQAIAVSGTNLFAGTSGGVFLSTNNGTSWAAINNGLTNANVQALAVNGTNLYAGTGGVFLSTNNGSSWTSVTGTRGSVRALAVSGTNLIAGCDSGTFVSTNNGTSWTQASSMSNRTLSLAVSGTNVFAGTGSGVFLSTNNGTTWTQTGLMNTVVRALAVSGTNIFAGSYTYGGVFLSTNNGTSWNAVTGLVDSVFAIGVNDTNLFVGAGGGRVHRRSLNDLMVLLTPAYGLGGITPPFTFKWSANRQALTYAFQVSTDAGFSNLVVNQYTVDTIYTVSNLQPTTAYYWRVRAENTAWASEWGNGRFTTKLASAPQLSSPTSGATLVSVTPTLSWNSVVSTATYSVQVSTQPAFGALVYSIDTISTSVPLPQLQRSTIYYWRVRAQTIGDTTAWSSASNFTTIPSVPNRMTLVYPDSNKQNAYQNDWLIWKGESTAATYLVQISQGPLFTAIYDSATIRDVVYRNPNRTFTSGATYFWRVKGSNTSGDGEFSSIWSFKVGSSVRVPVTSYSSLTLDCGRVKVGLFKDTVLTISNTGTDTLRIQNISSSSSVFNLRPTTKTLVLGQSFVDTIRFAPTVIGTGTSIVIFSSNSSTGKDTIRVSGFGYGQGVASVNAANVTMGRTMIGQYADTTLTLANTGNDTLKIASITSSNPVFSVRIPSRMLPPGQILIDTIRYTPTAIGTASANIVVTSNSPTSPDTVKVSGFGYGEASASISPLVISFGSIKVWQYKDTLVTISNQGNDTLKIQRINVYGGMFSVRPSSGVVLPGKSLSDTIRFSPSFYGNMQATIVLSSNSPSGGDTIRASGVGLAGALKFNVARMDFGLVLLGRSKDTAVTILNPGNDTLMISSITCKHPAIISSNTSFMIAPGGSAIDTFRFVPQSVGSVLGSMLFVSNGLTTYDTLRVTGSGVTATTGIEQEGIPGSFELKQNYPNPFNPNTIISYSLPMVAIVSLRIFNPLGQEVAVLVNEQKEAGRHLATWNASVPSGIYFYRIQAGGYVETKKMILLK